MGAVYWEGKDYSDLKSCINALLHVATKLEKEMTVEELFFGSDIFPNTIMSIGKLYNQACMIKASERSFKTDGIDLNAQKLLDIIATSKDMAATILKFSDRRVSADLKGKAMFVLESCEYMGSPKMEEEELHLF